MPAPNAAASDDATKIRQSLVGTERVMMLAPHPDDESIATGGVLLAAASAGVPLRVVYLTDGENNPWAQRAVERRWRIAREDRRRWGVRRRREALEALACLGVPSDAPRFLELEDQRLTGALFDANGEAARRVEAEIAAWKPTVLLAPSLDDRHPDHSATAILTQLVTARIAPKTIPKVFSYVVHRAAGRDVSESAIRHDLSPSERDAKMRAILCHASQLKLRRRFMLSFADGPERFRLGSPTEVGVDPGHPLRLVQAAGEQWSFLVRSAFHAVLGRSALLLVAEADGKMGSLRVPLPRTGKRGPLLGFDRRETIGEVTARRNGGSMYVTIASPLLCRNELRLARLELPWEKNLRFFDRWPWLSFGLGASPLPQPNLEHVELTAPHPLLEPLESAGAGAHPS